MDPDNTQTQPANIQDKLNPKMGGFYFKLLVILIIIFITGILVFVFEKLTIPSTSNFTNTENVKVPSVILANKITPKNNTMDANLKEQLEEAYQKVSAVLQSGGTYESLLKVYEENDDPNLPPITEADWSMAHDSFSKAFPDISKINYVSLEEQKDYAYYYAWVNGDNALTSSDKINLWVYVFHNVSGNWKLTGYSQVISTTKTATDSESKLVTDNIDKLKKQVEEAMKR
jgi:hypothetical protein